VYQLDEFRFKCILTFKSEFINSANGRSWKGTGWVSVCEPEYN